MVRSLLAALAISALGCGEIAEGGTTPADPIGDPAEPVADATELAEALPRLAALEGDPTPFERAVGERMEALRAVTVEVEMLSEDGVIGHGSGVFVSSEGDVLTAAHVVEDRALHFRVLLPDGEARDAVVVARDDSHDAALLKTGGAATPYARTRAATRPESGGARSAAPMPGEWVVCAGYGGQVAGERLPMFSAGVVVDRSHLWSVTEYRRMDRIPVPSKTTNYFGMLESDCAVAAGMSGGPMVDLEGRLVGVVVGGGGVASPVDALHGLLARVQNLPDAVELAEAPLGAAPGVPSLARGEESLARGEEPPSRDAELRAMLALAKEPTVVELTIRGVAAGEARFPAVVVSSDGLAIAPAARLAQADEATTIEPEDMTVEDQPNARCAAILAVRGELALLRLEGLASARPAGRGRRGSIGEIVESIAPGVAHTLGFVTALDRHPGVVAQDTPRWGCGTMHRIFARENPAVTVTSALGHDVASPASGSLLVDRRGRPVAISVATRAAGLAFAIPWDDALARFGEWIGGGASEP